VSFIAVVKREKYYTKYGDIVGWPDGCGGEMYSKEEMQRYEISRY